MTKNRREVALILSTFVLLFGLLAITSAIPKSATFDEPNKLMSGYANLKWHDYRLVPDHPPLAKMITALPLLALTVPDLRAQGQLWEDSLVDDNAQRLFTQTMLYRGDADWILFWGRVPVIALAVLLGFIVFLWAKELYGSRSAIVALLLYGLDPNILAHGRLATSDLALTFFTFLSLYAFRTVWRRFTASSALICSFVVGCAVLSKHTGWLVPLTLLLLGGTMVFSKRPWMVASWGLGPLTGKKSKALLLLTFVLITALVIYAMIWACYGFRYRAVSAPLTTPLSLSVPDGGPGTATLRAMEAIRFLPEAYLEGLNLALSRMRLGHHYFLLGERSTAGWWSYFLVAFFVKTPLATLVLLGLACGLAVTRRVPLRGREFFLIVPAGVYFLASSWSRYDLGLRYILPVYPFLFVFIGRLVPWCERVEKKRRALAAILFLLWYAISTQSIYPHYLAYFNEIAGGPERGYRILVDSNLDWGQDLKGLKRWMVQNRIDLIGLSYFGTADPRYYGIPFVYLPSIPFYYPRREGRGMERRPGYVAISATNLQGVFLNGHDWQLIAPFLKRRPVTKIGYSIFVYRSP